jgi:hypothetical protein
VVGGVPAGTPSRGTDSNSSSPAGERQMTRLQFVKDSVR